MREYMATYSITVYCAIPLQIKIKKKDNYVKEKLPLKIINKVNMFYSKCQL